ncbi:putative cytochrome bd-I oxidase subunit II [Ilumatobacter coccineus YM16-304] [Mycobacterium shimoidei]|uniref:Putative cytochrome bd-I oxidase subunit II [Ilumatobacter coccineus YM16-304] n=1 Tax=Mycobacterium shimoidei TaxID=29313 RepID=A0A375Z339_MYCSH|nr:cytochrome d ubiquinol oxidase subunit II [Mycobacterium shimoidei]SRX95395.1 putative cytochrome bd-I oxidase subunit II [Ilumatobacter coccineus YM16-304] [Mycobacterium shimoidei]
MSLSAAVAAAMFVGVIVYALLGGADFGSGFYDLTAGRGRHGAEVRTLIDHSIGPVWEANHVWLIYILVIWWTGFPKAFAAATTTLFTPLILALAGIVLRGSSFAFRKYAATFGQARLFGAIFAGSSLITPFFFGTVAGAIASGRVPANGYGDPVGSWVNLTSLVGGCLAVTTCVFLAGIFLTADAVRIGDAALAGRLRVRTLAVGLVAGVIVFAGLYPILDDAPTLSSGLLGRALPLLVIAALAGATTLLLLYRSPSVARMFAALAVAAVVAGWGVGQYPWMLTDQLRIADAAGAPATLAALLVVVALAGVIVVPPLTYLLWFTQTAESKPATPLSPAEEQV